MDPQADISDDPMGTTGPPAEQVGKRKRRISSGDSPESISKKQQSNKSSKSEQQKSRDKDTRNYKASDEALRKSLVNQEAVMTMIASIYAIVGIRNDEDVRKVKIVELPLRLSDKVANQSHGVLDSSKLIHEQTANLLNTLKDRVSRDVPLVPDSGGKSSEKESENTKQLKKLQEGVDEIKAILQQNEQNTQKAGEALEKLLPSSDAQDQATPPSAQALAPPGRSEVFHSSNVDFEPSNARSAATVASGQFDSLNIAVSNETDPNDFLESSIMPPELLDPLGDNQPFMLDPFQGENAHLELENHVPLQDWGL